MRDWMEKARRNRGLTMKAIATELGISESYYSMIERGERQQSLTLSLAAKLSSVLGVSLEYIGKQEDEKSGGVTDQTDT